MRGGDEENHEKSEPGLPILGPGFEPSTSLSSLVVVAGEEFQKQFVVVALPSSWAADIKLHAEICGNEEVVVAYLEELVQNQTGDTNEGPILRVRTRRRSFSTLASVNSLWGLLT